MPRKKICCLSLHISLVGHFPHDFNDQFLSRLSFSLFEIPLQVTEKQGEQTARMINGEAVSHRQPLLISGGVMRSYQLDGLDWMRGN